MDEYKFKPKKKSYNREVLITQDKQGKLIVFIPYNPIYIRKIKRIEGYRWDPVNKYWWFTKSNEILKKILAVFNGENILVDTLLKDGGATSSERVSLTPNVLCPSQIAPIQTQNELSNNNSPQYTLEDLEKELVTRKYSYKTVKAYL